MEDEAEQVVGVACGTIVLGSEVARGNMGEPLHKAAAHNKAVELVGFILGSIAFILRNGSEVMIKLLACQLYDR